MAWRAVRARSWIPNASMHAGAPLRTLRPCQRADREQHKLYAELRVGLKYSAPQARPEELNCLHNDWPTMLEDQRAFVVAAAAVSNTSMPDNTQCVDKSCGRLQCGFGSFESARPRALHTEPHRAARGARAPPHLTPRPRASVARVAVYNQVHLRWDVEDIKAIFYVNDTETPRRLFRARFVGATVDAAEAADLHNEALAAAARSYRAALQARHAHPHLMTLPVVQYRVTSDCFVRAPPAPPYPACRADTRDAPRTAR